MVRISLAVVGAVASACAANAQSNLPPFTHPSRSIVEGVGVPGPSQAQPFAASNGVDVLRHRAPTGIPCLEVGGFSRPHIIDLKLYDHVITVKNGCAQKIALQICYYEFARLHSHGGAWR